MAGVNDIIGNYRLVKELASGAYGRVYQAEHIILTNRTVAIKLLHGAHLNSLKDRENFLQEARILERLKHSYILPIIDVGIHEGFPYLVVEYAPNGSLRTYLQHRSIHQFREEEIYTILSQVGQALQHAHEEHIIHRDLKPENILFNAKGEALLADFGVATVLSTMTINYNVTVIGTPAYMAPEQFRGAVSKASDQYALGCIAYELYTGQKPFTASDLASFMFQHLMENPIAPTRYNPSLPAHIERAILKAMAKERTERHADISAFVTALQVPDITQTKKSARSHTDIPFKSRVRSSSTSSADQKSKEQWLDHALAYQKAKQFAKAIVAIDNAIRLDPTYVEAYMCKGDAFYNLGRHQEALAAFEQAIKHNPKDKFAHNHRGNALYELGLYEEALVAYERAIRLDPNFAEAYFNKGNVLDDLEHYEEALAAYEQAIRLDPNDADFYNNMGHVLNEVGRNEEALAACEQAIHLDPNDAVTQNTYGDVLCELGFYEEALAAYDQCIRLNPNNATVHNDRGYALNKLGHYEEALVACEQAISLDTDNVDAYYNKGLVLHKLKRYHEALETLDEAIQRDPDNAYLWQSKGDTLKLLRWSEGAHEAYERARQLGYHH